MLNDLRYALRTLRRSPGFAAGAILALALGIGANTAVFSVVYAVLLKPLPYDQPDRLIRLYERNPARGIERGDVSPGTFVDWRARSHTLASAAAYTMPLNGQTLWAYGDRFEAVRTARVSPALFPLLGVSPILGRTFRSESEQMAPSGDNRQVVISYGLWQRAFGGAADVVGRCANVEGRYSAEIIGVMPPGFAFPEGSDAWANLAFLAPLTPAARRAGSYAAIGRLSPNATTDAAAKELVGISRQLASEQPASNDGWSATIVPLAGSDTGSARPALLALLAAVVAVLLIGCSNVANLLLARASARRREFAVRMALGAGIGRLVRQGFAEALVLASCGSLVGVLLGQGLCGVLLRLAPPNIPRLADVHMNGALLLFATGAGLSSAVCIGLAPALHLSRADRRGALRPDARTVTASGAATRRLLIAGEVTAVVVLLTGALLLLRTFVKLRGVDLGFQTTHVLNVSTRWPIGRLFPTGPGVRPWPRIQRAVDGLVAAVSNLPGVDAVGLISDVPLADDPISGTVWRADSPGASGRTPPADPRARWKADLSIVTTGYFPAMGIPFVRGRNFVEADRLTDDQLNASVPSSRLGAVVINNAFASRYFPSEDPIGRTLVLDDDRTFGSSRTIVGVVADVRGHAISEAPAPAMFVPHAEHPDVFVPSLIVRSSLPPDSVASAIRQRIATYDPQLLVQGIRPMHEVVLDALSRQRFNLLLIGSFAATALLLAAVGIYGVVGFVVTQRTREIGIRMALGARAADVVRLVLREGMAPVVLGSIAGMFAAFVATRAIRTMLFGITPLDPVSFAVAPAVLAAVALLACYLPTRRATRVDPVVALRDE
jgi:putative ABC transport system permease protein